MAALKAVLQTQLNIRCLFYIWQVCGGRFNEDINISSKKAWSNKMYLSSRRALSLVSAPALNSCKDKLASRGKRGFFWPPQNRLTDQDELMHRRIDYVNEMAQRAKNGSHRSTRGVSPYMWSIGYRTLTCLSLYISLPCLFVYWRDQYTGHISQPTCTINGSYDAACSSKCLPSDWGQKCSYT